MNLPSKVLNATNIRAPKGIIYGPPGIGKTSLGANTYKPILIDCENGAAHVKCDRTPYLTDWISIKQWLDALATTEHDYATVVIDSLDWLLRRVEEHVSGVDGSSTGMSNTLNRSHGGYGNGKQVLKNYVYQYLLPILDKIVNRNIAVILLAHATRQEFTNIDGITLEKSTPEIHPDLSNTMIEWSDFVAAARIRNGQRMMILSETAQQLAKNRYGIEGELPLDWHAFINAMSSKEASNVTS